MILSSWNLYFFPDFHVVSIKKYLGIFRKDINDIIDEQYEQGMPKYGSLRDTRENWLPWREFSIHSNSLVSIFKIIFEKEKQFAIYALLIFELCKNHIEWNTIKCFGKIKIFDIGLNSRIPLKCKCTSVINHLCFLGANPCWQLVILSWHSSINYVCDVLILFKKLHN